MHVLNYADIIFAHTTFQILLDKVKLNVLDSNVCNYYITVTVDSYNNVTSDTR